VRCQSAVDDFAAHRDTRARSNELHSSRQRSRSCYRDRFRKGRTSPSLSLAIL
jgi:hypothetical protein